MQPHSNSRLTTLPYDVLHEILSLAVPPLPSIVHLNIDSSPSYLNIFRTSRISECPPILLVCRLLTRHVLRMIYKEVRVVIHPDRFFLKAISKLRARKHVQHIDLAVELRPWRYDPKIPTKSRRRHPHDLQIKSFYSPAYFIGIIQRAFPKLATVHLTIIETAPLRDAEKATSPRFDAADTADNEVLHMFSSSLLTQSNSIDACTWNHRIISLRYKASQEFTDLSDNSLASASAPLSPAIAPSLPTFLRSGADGTHILNGNDIWRERTRRLMDIASQYTNTTNKAESSRASPLPAASAPVLSPNPEAAEPQLETGDSVTNFILHDAEEDVDGPAESLTNAQDQPLPPEAAGTTFDPSERHQTRIQHPNIPNFSFPFRRPATSLITAGLNSTFNSTSTSGSTNSNLASSSTSPLTTENASRMLTDSLNRLFFPHSVRSPIPLSPPAPSPSNQLASHILTHFSPFSPATLPNLTSVTFYLTTQHSRSLTPGLTRLQPHLPANFIQAGVDGSTLARHFRTLLSPELFGTLPDEKITVRRVLESTTGRTVGWEDMDDVDLRILSAQRNLRND